MEESNESNMFASSWYSVRSWLMGGTQKPDEKHPSDTDKAAIINLIESIKQGTLQELVQNYSALGERAKCSIEKILNNDEPILILAVKSEVDTLEKVKYLVEKDYGILNDSTILHTAAKFKKEAIIEFIFKKYHNPEKLILVKNRTEYNAIDEAIYSKNYEIAQMLYKRLTRNNKFLLLTDTDDKGNTFLHKLMYKKVPYEFLSCLFTEFSESQRKEFFEKRNIYGRTLLHQAVIHDNKDAVFFLINNGASSNAVIEVKEGTSPFEEDYTDPTCYFNGSTILHWAKGEILEILLRDYENIKLLINDNNNVYRCTPLHSAVIGCRRKDVETLLEHNANIEAIDYEGMTSLHLAVIGKNNAELVEDLTKNCPRLLLVQDKFGMTVLHWAISKAGLGVVKKLLKTGHKYSLLQEMLKIRATSRCVIILGDEHDVHDKIALELYDPFRNTSDRMKINNYIKKLNEIKVTNASPPELVCSTVQHSLIDSFRTLCDNNLLLRSSSKKEFTMQEMDQLAQPQPNIASAFMTLEGLELDEMVRIEDEAACPLLSALVAEDPSAILQAKKLCEEDTNLLDITQQDANQNNALHLAAMHGNIDILELGSKSGLDLTATNKYGMSALHFAVIKGHKPAVKWLLDKNKLLSKTALTVEIGKEAYSCSPLQLAVLFNQADTLDALLEYAESLYHDPHTTTELGNVLHAAILVNNMPILSHLLQNKEIVEKFLESVNKGGQTPLALAALLGCNHAIKLLTDVKADVNRSCNDNWRPIHYAVKGRKIHTVNNLFWFRANIQALAKDDTTPLALAKKLEDKAQTKADLAEKSKDEAGKKRNQTKKRLYSLVRGRLTNLINETEGAHGLMDVGEIGAYKNLVIQGGGAKGIAHQGALEILHEKRVLANLRRVAGTSAGAIAATLVALNFTPKEIGNIISTEMEQFLELDKLQINLPELKASLSALWDEISEIKKKEESAAKKVCHYAKAAFSQSSAIHTVYQLFTQLTARTGVASGDRFLAWFDGIIQQKLKEAKLDNHIINNFTFGKLGALVAQGRPGYKHLYMVATCIDNKEQPEFVVFNSEEERWKDVRVVDAVRASMSIPFVFEPYPVSYPDSEDPSQNIKRHFVDGGMIVNYPIYLFDKVFYVDPHAAKKWRHFPRYNEETLGLRLKAGEGSEVSLQAISKNLVAEEKPDIKQLLWAMIQTFYFAEELLFEFREDASLRSITLNTGDIGTLSMDMDQGAKDALIQAAKKVTKESPLISRLASAVIPDQSTSGRDEEEVTAGILRRN